MTKANWLVHSDLDSDVSVHQHVDFVTDICLKYYDRSVSFALLVVYTFIPISV